MNKERLEHGAAVIKGTLGGARAHASLAAMIAAIDNCFQTGNSLEAYSDDMVLAIADIDSELEHAATDRARLAGVVAGNADLRRSASESAKRAEDLQARNDNQAITIGQYEARIRELTSECNIAEGERATHVALIASLRGEKLMELAPTEGERVAPSGDAIRSNTAWRELAAAAIIERNKFMTEARNATEALHGANASVSEWKAEAEIAERLRKEAEADCELARRQRNAELASHNELAAVIAEASEVIAGLPLATTAVDGAQGLVKLYWRLELLAAETCGERHARHARADSGKAAAPVTLKAELLGILDSVSEELIESQDALHLIRLFADRL